MISLLFLTWIATGAYNDSRAEDARANDARVRDARISDSRVSDALEKVLKDPNPRVRDPRVETPWDQDSQLQNLQDLGTYGHTMDIEEEDLIEQLQKKMATVDIDALQEGLREKVRSWSPAPVLGLGTACRVHFYDPTIKVPFDIKDHKGRVLYRQGTRVNPLHYRSFTKKWLFVDGEQPLPVVDSTTKVILVRGNPFVKDRPLYFDQGGLLVKKFGIQNIPALLEQEGDRIRIQEGICP